MNSQPAATIVIDIRTQVVSRKMGSLGFAVVLGETAVAGY